MTYTLVMTTQDTPTFTLTPIPDKQYEGRQYGWHILRDRQPYLDVSTGGTGACWNIDHPKTPESMFAEVGIIGVHLCDLEEFIAALEALRDSEAHRDHVERWS